MINKDKWIDSLPKEKTKFSQESCQLETDRWLNTIPKRHTFNSVKKYSFMLVLFVSGLLFVSAVKNETRNLQKEINNLETSINHIQFNLNQAILDNEVITSPENIARLAKEYLNTDLVSYKKSQIISFDDDIKTFDELDKLRKEKSAKKKEFNLKKSAKLHVSKKIEKKRKEIKKLQELYKDPNSIPDEVKSQVAKKIQETKIELKNVYNSPKDAITLERFGRWSAIQVVKVFLGMPIVPGR